MTNKTNSPPKPYLGFGTRIRKSPFFESTLKWGCKEYTTYNHMYFPVYYNTPEEDFWSLVNDVHFGMFLLKDKSKLQVLMQQNLLNY